MKDNLIPIGKMAAMNRVSVPTLRLYDEKGLLKPRYVDPGTGYRYYDIDQNARLDMIAYMKELGMSLAQIAQVLQKEDISLIEELLSQKTSRSTSRCVGSKPSTTRWSGRSCPSSGTASPRRPARSLWSISTGASPGASPARTTFIRTTCTATSRACARCG